jgi:hypothetical protein
MSSNSIKNIIKLAEYFERRVSLANKDIDLNELHNSKLVREIKRIAKLKTPISSKEQEDEMWKSWYITNMRVISEFINKNWIAADDTSSVYWDSMTNTKIYLSTKYIRPTDLAEKFEHLIRGVGAIPNIFIIGVEDEKYISDEAKSATFYIPEIAHNEWLLTACQELFSFGYRKEDYEQIKAFIENNRDVIRKIRSSFSSRPEVLGMGADGITFDIGEGKILKIFKEEYSYIKAKEAIERLHKNPDLAKTEAMMYDVGKFFPLNRSSRFYDKSNDRDVYYYIMEKMSPVSKIDGELKYQLMHVIDIVVADIKNDQKKWKDIKNNIDDPKQSSSIKKIVENKANDTAKSLSENPQHKYLINEISKNPQLHKDWLISFIEQIIMKYLTGRTDIATRNLGITGYGKLVYFDPAYGEHLTSF